MSQHAEPAGRLYASLRLLARFWIWFLFREVAVRGAARVPATGPVLLCVNHPNNLIDSVLVAGVLPRKVHFLANASLFRNRLLGAREERAEQPVADQGRGGEDVNLSREDSRQEEGVDQVVGMVHAEEDRPGRGHARGAADRNLAEEEPDPEARQEPQRGVETARGLGVLAHGWASVSRR